MEGLRMDILMDGWMDGLNNQSIFEMLILENCSFKIDEYYIYL